MRNALLIGLAAIVFTSIAVGVVTMKVSVWNECRPEHSWLYCFHLISN